MTTNTDNLPLAEVLDLDAPDYDLFNDDEGDYDNEAELAYTDEESDW